MNNNDLYKEYYHHRVLINRMGLISLFCIWNSL